MQDVQFNICELPAQPSSYSTLISFPNMSGADPNAGHHKMGLSIQAELATFTFLQIGHFSKASGDVIDKLSTAVAEGFIAWLRTGVAEY